MIDIYPQIYQELDTHIADYLKSEKCANVLKKKKVKLQPEFNANTTVFPYITIGEKGNTYADSELDNHELHSSLVFDINIYDNTKNKMEICSKLSLVVNDYMANKMGLRRTFNEPMPNLADATIYRITQRYEGFINNETGKITKNLI